MIVQFFDYGSGLSKGPLDYLLGKNRDREHAKIISGDEKKLQNLLIQALSQKNIQAVA